MCNSVNLKRGRIIEPLLKIVNVLCMCPRVGVVHSDQPAQHGYGGVRSVGAFIAFKLAKSAKRFCALKDFVCKWYSSLEVEVVSATCACTCSFALAHDQVFHF